MSPTPSNIEQDDEIDLAELWRAIWSGKITIIIVTAIFAIASVFYALSKPDVYKASVLLAPVSSESGGGLAGLAGQFGGLASMAGINLGGSGGDKTSLALATLKSRSFIENFIENHELLVPLMAAKKWDRETDKLILNNELYDEEKEIWIQITPEKTTQPTPWESYKSFSNLIDISQDKANSLITLKLSFYSPELAKQWLTLLVSDINKFIREQEKEETKASIAYLKEQLEVIQVSNMETVFYQLIEEQTKTMMLAQVKKEYVFKTIDPAQAPEVKNSPKRALIVLLGTMLGGILSVLIVLVLYFRNIRTA